MNSIDQGKYIELPAYSPPEVDGPGTFRQLVSIAISRRRVIIPLVDCAILTLAVGMILLLFPDSFASLSPYQTFAYLAFSVGLTLFSFYIFGLYDSIGRIGHLELAYRLTKVFVLASVLNIVICLAFGIGSYFAYPAIMFAILGWCVCIRHLLIRILIPRRRATRVMIICNDDESVDVARSLAESDKPVYEVAGCLMDGMTVMDPAPPLPVFQRNIDYLYAAGETEADIVALTDNVSDNTTKQLDSLVAEGYRLSHLYDIFERMTGKMPVSRAKFLRGTEKVDRPAYLIAKKTLDLTVAIAGCLMLLLLLVPVSVAIKATSRGPVFYAQTRCGKKGGTFSLLKFRTMVSDAEAGGPTLTEARDHRITPIGGFLRKTHIDEVPQFFNLLKGDLSLVGPRPERPEMIKKFKKEIPFFEYRQLIKPGITGWAQVSAPYAATVKAFREKVQYDFFYIKNRCFFLDLVILLKTAKSMVQMRGF